MGLQQTPQKRKSPWARYAPIIAIVVIIAIVGVVLAVRSSGSNNNKSNNVTPTGSNVTSKSGQNGVPLFYNDAKAQGVLDKYTWQDHCDTTTGEVAIPILDPPPCTPKVEQKDNGGATSPGVTADTIKIGYYSAKPDPILDTLTKQAGAYDTPQATDQAVKNYVQLYASVYNLYGRKIQLVRIPGTGLGTDAVAARADADSAAAAGVFAVIGGPAQAKQFSDELAAKKVLCIGTCIIAQPQKYYLDHQPYVWPTGPSPDQTSTLTSELIKTQLVGKPASFGGSDVNGKPRTFTLLTYDTPDGQFKSSWDDLEQKVKAAGANIVDHVDYYLNLPTLAADARTTAARLKQKGATTIIFTGDPIFPQGLTAEMTKLNYFPEWVMSGTVLADTNVFARKFDQQQWKHAMGIQLIPARIVPQKQDSYTVHEWYFKTKPPTDNNFAIVKGNVEALMNGLQAAGAHLTPASFKNGMDALPPDVDPANPTLRTITTYGQHNFWPGTPDDPAGLDNAGVMWWDPNAQGPDETGSVGAGMYRLMDGGLRYLPGKWPTTPLKFFDPAGTVTIYGANNVPPDLTPKDEPPPPGSPAAGG
jgi:hypothetical protein